ncbi:unnamed protein product [Chrysoparadoxa australica]
MEKKEVMRGFRSQLDRLGSFPDKSVVQMLTQMADRHQEYAMNVVAQLEGLILDAAVPREHKLPVCYLVDSILKNIGEPYISLFARRVEEWFRAACEALDERSLNALGRVLSTWEKDSMFSPETLISLRASISGSDGHAVVNVADPNLPMSEAGPAMHEAPLPQQAAPLGLDPGGPEAEPRADFEALVEERMRALLSEQMEGLDSQMPMTVEMLWQVNHDLAAEYRQVAEGQVSEELGRLLPMQAEPAEAPQQIELQQPVIIGEVDMSRAKAMAEHLLSDINSAISTPDQGDWVQVVSKSVYGLMELFGIKGMEKWRERARVEETEETIRALLGSGRPCYCTQDGQRFSTPEQLAAHLDLLFRRRRARQEHSKGGTSRPWYCTASQWVTDFGKALAAGRDASQGKGSVEATQDGGGAPVAGECTEVTHDQSAVPADEHFPKCSICGEVRLRRHQASCNPAK